MGVCRIGGWKSLRGKILDGMGEVERANEGHKMRERGGMNGCEQKSGRTKQVGRTVCGKQLFYWSFEISI